MKVDEIGRNFSGVLLLPMSTIPGGSAPRARNPLPARTSMRRTLGDFFVHFNIPRHLVSRFASQVFAIINTSAFFLQSPFPLRHFHWEKSNSSSIINSVFPGNFPWPLARVQTRNCATIRNLPRSACQNCQVVALITSDLCSRLWRRS